MRAHDGRRGGFALAMVVFMLFAATVAGLTGYQIVSTESLLADGSENTDEALAVADAGLQRYVGEHIGIPGSSTYAVGDGSVTISPQKVARVNDSTDLYLLTAVGTVTDPRYPTSPATRTVYQYAHLNRRPVKARAAFLTIQSTVNVGNNSAVIDGTAVIPNGASTDCPAGDANNVGNINSLGAAGTAGNAAGNTTVPVGRLGYYQQGATPAVVIAAAGLRWSVLKDPTFPVPYDGTWPNFASIPADSFPVIRVTGNYALDRTGRGALIVTGTFTTPSQSDTWSGIVLAGDALSTGYVGGGNGQAVRGIVVSGLNGTPFVGTQTINRFQVNYYPCWVRRANLALAYLSPVSRSTWAF